MTDMAMTRLEDVTPEGIAGVLQGWQATGEPFHVLALLPDEEKARVPILQAACRKAGLALGGALFPQLIHDGALHHRGVVLLKVTEGPPPLLIEDVASLEAVERTCEEIGAYVEARVERSREASLFFVFDALVPNIGTHLDAWYLRLADRVRYCGVNAGNERFVSEPCLFDSERFVSDAVLVQILLDHPGACLDHGYSVPDHVITATSAAGNRIVQIDWRPPLDVYREIIRDEYGVEVDRDNFYAQAAHFPFGILRADGEVLVRIPVALGEGGEIICVGEIPPHSLLTLLDARSCTRQSPAALARQLSAFGTGAPLQELLLFYCAGRRMHVQEGMIDELAAVARETGARHIAGALSLGEIGAARSGGYPLFHNATLMGVPWRA